MNIQEKSTIDTCREIDFVQQCEKTANSDHPWGVTLEELELGGTDVPFTLKLSGIFYFT